jgi:hypothetical protein
MSPTTGAHAVSKNITGTAMSVMASHKSVNEICSLTDSSNKEKEMLTITGLSNGKCTWCLESTEVVTAQFRDGLTGTFCKKHLWQALKVRNDSQPTATTPKTNAGVDERISGKT